MNDDADKQTVENGDDGRGEAGRFAPGNAGGPGRPKGEPNRIGADLKTDLWEAYQQRGGAKWLETLPPRVFVGLLAKLLPRDLHVEAEAHGIPIRVVMFGQPEPEPAGMPQPVFEAKVATSPPERHTPARGGHQGDDPPSDGPE